MKSPLAKLSGFVCFVCIIVLSVTVMAAGETSSFRPQWHTDLVWRVKAVYATPGIDNSWSQPVLWEYSISKSENSSPEDGFIYINARCLDEMASRARFTYRKKDFTMVRAEISNIVRGHERIKTLTFAGGEPVATRQSPIPYDAPVFPLYPGLTKEYQTVAMIDNLLKKQSTIEQIMTVVPGGTSPLPEWTTGRRLLKVECRNKADEKRLFVQYWDEEFPWPVYGENDNMKYWMEVK